MRGLGIVAALVAPAAVLAQVGDDRLLLIDGQELRGRVRSATDDAVAIDVATGASQRLGLAQVDRIDFATTAQPPAVADSLWLQSGQALPATCTGGTADTGEFTLPTGQAIAVPWRFVRAVRLASSAAKVDDGFAARIATPLDDQDLLWALADDGALRRLSLRVTGIEANRIGVDFQGEPRSLARERVYGIVFASQSRTRPDRQPNPRVTVVWAGHELAGKLAALDDETLRVRCDEGFTLALARGDVASISVGSDKLLPLTELTPTVEQTPAFDKIWPPLRDAGPGGGAILVRGTAYRRGLVLVPRTRLTFAIDARYDYFEAVVAMEDRAGPRADAAVRVLGDGAILFDTPALTRATEPQAIRVPVAGVKLLTLEADFGKHFDLGDLCVFAAPRLRAE